MQSSLRTYALWKKRIKLSKKAFHTEQVSAIIKNKAMVKYKDLVYSTISVQIGHSFVERALLHLGANVNLLLYSIYKQLGLGELKAMSKTGKYRSKGQPGVGDTKTRGDNKYSLILSNAR